MTYTITSGIADVTESTHVFHSDIAAREYVRQDYDFMSDSELDTLFTAGHVEWPSAFDSLDWIRLTVTP
jgi:hypothetical protein